MPAERPGTVVRRLLWFAAFWAGGVATVTAVGLLIRWLLMP